MTFSDFSFGEAGGIYLAFALSISVVKRYTAANNHIYHYPYRSKKKYKLLKLISNKPKKTYKNGDLPDLDQYPKKKKNDLFCFVYQKKENVFHNIQYSTYTTCVGGISHNGVDNDRDLVYFGVVYAYAYVYVFDVVQLLLYNIQSFNHNTVWNNNDCTAHNNNECTAY